jgi:FkbM family methyltransferase
VDLNLRTNRHVRSFLHASLKGYTTSRRYRTRSEARLWFPAGKHLNLFFQRQVSMDPTITENLRRLVREHFLIFDIGANIGYYTVLFSLWTPRGSVVAIEPDPANLPILHQNIVRNRLTNITVIDKAIGHHPRTATLYRDVHTGRTSSLEDGAWRNDGAAVMPSTVDVVTLDSLTARFGAPQVIKCDVEGHEMAVLKGAPETLAYHPVLVLEVKYEDREAMTTLLKKYGYRFYDAEELLGTRPPYATARVYQLLAIAS